LEFEVGLGEDRFAQHLDGQAPRLNPPKAPPPPPITAMQDFSPPESLERTIRLSMLAGVGSNDSPWETVWPPL
jgi:hypothetical protein